MRESDTNASKGVISQRSSTAEINHQMQVALTCPPQNLYPAECAALSPNDQHQKDNFVASKGMLNISPLLSRRYWV